MTVEKQELHCETCFLEQFYFVSIVAMYYIANVKLDSAEKWSQLDNLDKLQYWKS